MFWFKFYNTIDPIKKPTPMATTIDTTPGTRKLWLMTNFPIFVLPVLSKLIAAKRVGYPGKTKSLFTAGKMAISAGLATPKVIPYGIIALAVAAWLNIKIPSKKTAMENVHG